MDSLCQQIACDQSVISGPKVHSDLVPAKGIESDDREFIVSTAGCDVVAFAHPQDRRLGQSVDGRTRRASDLHTITADSLDREFVGCIVPTDDQKTVRHRRGDIPCQEHSGLELFDP